MKAQEVIDVFNATLFCSYKVHHFTYDEGLQTFYDGPHEIEFQIRSLPNGDFDRLLMRFCEDMTHTYIELYLSDFKSVYEMIEYALMDGPEELEEKTICAMNMEV